MRALIATLLFACAAGASIAASADDFTDLRGVRIGMNATEMPTEGYRDLACETPEKKALSAWSEWRSCAADAAGLRRLRADYDQLGEETTKIAGHPVDLTFSFGDDGRLTEILIATDNHARPFMRKKAYLFGEQAKRRYGDINWTCSNEAPAAGEEAIGPTFVKERCEKKLGDREVLVEMRLFRMQGSEAKDFVSETRVSIRWSPSKT
jgi:hypothetical protein